MDLLPEMAREYAGIALVPLLIGFLEVLKIRGISTKRIPVIAVVLGVIMGVTLLGQGDVKVGVIQGLAIGLSAMGLYSGTKNSLE